MDYAFFAMISRLRWIDRWALMRNSDNENLSEHSLEVAILSHALATIGNKKLGKSLNAEKAALFGLYHDVSEILTGDMPTPVKYHNAGIRRAFGEIETAAQQTILDTLPEDIRDEFAPLICPDETDELYKLVKAADKLSALLRGKYERFKELMAKKDVTDEDMREISQLEVFLDEIPDYLALDISTEYERMKSEFEAREDL